MKKTIVVILLLSLGFASCTEKQQILTKKDVQNRVDSAFKIKMDEINRQAREDLDYRTSIEVKAKADSIVAAKNTPKDSLIARQKREALQQPQSISEMHKRRFDSVMKTRRFPHVPGK